MPIKNIIKKNKNNDVSKHNTNNEWKTNSNSNICGNSKKANKDCSTKIITSILEKLLNVLTFEKKIIEEISGYIIYKNIKIGEDGAIDVFYGVEKGFKIELW